MAKLIEDARATSILPPRDLLGLSIWTIYGCRVTARDHRVETAGIVCESIDVRPASKVG